MNVQQKEPSKVDKVFLHLAPAVFGTIIWLILATAVDYIDGYRQPFTGPMVFHSIMIAVWGFYIGVVAKEMFDSLRA